MLCYMASDGCDCEVRIQGLLESSAGFQEIMEASHTFKALIMKEIIYFPL